MAPQVEDAVQAYIDESHSKAVGIIPLKRPVDPTLAPDDKDVEPPEVLGALIVEQIEDSRPREGLMQRVEVVTEHSSTALANALEYHDLFLLPVWQALGKAQWVLKARTLPKTIAIASAVVLLILFLVFWPADFNLEGKGTLEPADRRDVFAALDGVVIDLPVEHGQMVHKGDVLARMRNTDLQVSLADISGKLSSTTEELFATRRQMQDAKKMNTQEYRQAESKVAELTKTRESYEKQLKLYKEKQQQLVITSPIDGQINTWQLRELLLHRPVRQGQVLMSVADPAGDWEAELHMPEDRMGHVAIARKEIQPDLPVRFFVATSPGDEHVGKVKDVSNKAESKQEEGSTVMVRVSFDKAQLKPTDLRPGATVTGKVNCGRVSIGYKFLHPVFAWLQAKVWFRIF
jgi:multidrug efflux pump subunit AcrA (membrane-fusion protein)